MRPLAILGMPLTLLFWGCDRLVLPALRWITRKLDKLVDGYFARWRKIARWAYGPPKAIKQIIHERWLDAGKGPTTYCKRDEAQAYYRHVLPMRLTQQTKPDIANGELHYRGSALVDRLNMPWRIALFQ